MAQLNLKLLPIILLTLLFSILFLVNPSLAKPNHSQTIESSCNETLYPNLCKRCLSKYAHNPKINGLENLAQVALSVSLNRALHTKGYLIKVSKELKSMKNNQREYLKIKDCVTQITDSVEQLSEAIKELRRLNKGGSRINDDVMWHISNVETWVSTALTDASTCVYSFPSHKMSKRTASIKVKALNVAQVTSNALALFHSYANKYKQEAARSTKRP